MSVVISVLARDLATLERHARVAAQHARCDRVELRFDALANPGVERLAQLFRGIGKPVIVALNGPEAFGTFAGTLAERRELLRDAARAGAAFVDVDHSLAHAIDAIDAPCRRIVSRHNTSGTPIDLEALLADTRQRARPSDMVKLVTHAERAEDGMRMLALVARESAEKRAFVGFTSGERGSFTRVLAPLFGSPWTYVAPAATGVEDAPRTAPGQLRIDELARLLPARFGLRTEIFAVLGRPARHSLSPRLHTALFCALGRDALFVAIEPDDLAAFLALARDPRWRGFSVTAPFKEDAFALATTHVGATQRARAANTLVRADAPDGTECEHPGRASVAWTAHNTDVTAVRAVIGGALCGESRIQDMRAVVVGSGGAARAALVALSGAKLAISARNEAARATLAREFGAEELPSLESLGTPADERIDVIVHTTPLGSLALPGVVDIPERVFASHPIVLDAVYRPARTELLTRAARAGAKTIPGRAWFLEQARHQSRLFTGVDPDPSVLERAFDEALGEDESREALDARSGASEVKYATASASTTNAPTASAPSPSGAGCTFDLAHPRARPDVIAFIGLRASGKSAVGQQLAERLGARFVDLDDEIARAHARPERTTAGEVLTALGEPAFRALESATLTSVLAQWRTEAGDDRPCAQRAPSDPRARHVLVLATGGGVVESSANRALLARAAWCVLLDAPTEVLLARLTHDTRNRPLLAGSTRAEELEILRARRSAWYRELAGLTLSNDGSMPPHELAERAFHAWKQAVFDPVD